MRFKIPVLFLLGMLEAFVMTPVVAGVSLDASRIVFTQANTKQGQSIGVTSSPQPDTPYIVRAMLLTASAGDGTNTPFVVSPSLFRLEPGSTNQLRIMQKDDYFQRDRESVYYLRVISQPAGKDNVNRNAKAVGGSLVVSTATVIKLFYRPSGLPGSAQQAMGQLTFTLKGQQLYVYNPSPYFVTLSSLTVGRKAVPLSVKKQNTMLAPFSGMHYPVEPSDNTITWKTINDYGGTEVFNGTLDRS